MLSNLRVPTTTQIRALESEYIKEIGKLGTNWGQTLMEVAGRAAALTALGLWDANPGHVAIFCGRGNNGGDGLVVARYLTLWGVPCSAYLLGEQGDRVMTSNEAETNFKILEGLAADIHFLEGEDLPDSLRGICGNASLIIDALFGTGLTRPVEGDPKKVIEAINSSFRPVLAIDLPSGLDSDTGHPLGIAVRASRTVTFGFVKPGHLNHPGAELCGDLYLVDIGLPDFGNLPEYLSHLNEKPHIYITTCGAVQSVLPYRPDNSHKGTFGHVLTIAGSLGMSGAGVLAAGSALRIGAGLSYLATPKSLVNAVPMEEIVHRPLSETSEQTISPRALKEVTDMLDKISSVVLGPGLSQNSETVKFVHEILDLIDKPCVLDADALNALSENPQAMPTDARNFVITPHPRELSRLTGIAVGDLLADRVRSTINAAKRFNCIVVFKGAHTLVGSPDGEIYVNPTGNSGMATAGSGDVLSGIIGGLMAQGLTPFDAACAGVYIHGRAGDLAAQALGSNAGLVAGDIRSAIPLALASIVSGDLSSLEEQLSHSLLSN